MNLEAKALGSYCPLYTEAVRKIYDCYPPDRARQAEAVLRAYGEHAGKYGTCFPRMRAIMKRTHYSETTYKRAMVILGQLDYIRVHVEYSIPRDREEITYQLSPLVLHIGQEWRKYAFSLWSATSLRCNEIIHALPESEPESEPETKPESGTRIRTTTTTRTGNEGGDAEYGENLQKQPGIGQNQREALKPQREAQKEPQNASSEAQQQRSAKTDNQKYVPPPPPIRECKKPLADPKAESVALELVQNLNTRISQARQLVAQFGHESAAAGLEWWKLENTKRPAGFGLLKWWLEEHVVTSAPEDQPPRSSGMFGQYADLFEENHDR